jgi:hypothetical protein
MVGPKKQLSIKHTVQTESTFRCVIHTASHNNTKAQPYHRNGVTLCSVLQDGSQHSIASYCNVL